MATDDEKKLNDMGVLKTKTMTNKFKIHSGQMEVAVAMLLNYRVYTIVPNVHWGFGLSHECDMLAMDKDMRLTEIEIKISKADLKKDFEKSHGHKSKYISRLVYAVPEFLVDDALALVPASCGIVVVKQHVYAAASNMPPSFEARWLRNCKHDKTKSAITSDKAIELMRLGCMRIWTLKAHNNKPKPKPTAEVR